MDVALVLLAQLLQPDVGALGHENDVGHPGLILAEGLVFIERGLVVAGVAVGGGRVRADDKVLLEADVLVGR